MISKLTEIRCNEVDQVKRPLKPGNNPVERSIQLKGPRRSLARQTMNKKIAKGSRIKSSWIRVATEFWRFLKPNRTSKLIKIRAMDHLVDGSMAAASTSYKHDMVDCLVVFFLSFFLSLSLSRLLVLFVTRTRVVSCFVLIFLRPPNGLKSSESRLAEFH